MITKQEDCINQLEDIEIFGDTDVWTTITKVSSKNEGWMKSTKAMDILNVGCIVQVSTQRKNPDGSYSLAEALTFVPDVCVINVTHTSTQKFIRRELALDDGSYPDMDEEDYEQIEENEESTLLPGTKV